MNLETHRKIHRQIEELAKSKIKFDIQVQGDDLAVGSTSASFIPIHIEVKSLKELALVQSIRKTPLALEGANKVKIVGFKPNNCIKLVIDLIISFKQSPELRSTYPSLKFFTDQARTHYYNFDIQMIHCDPSEQVEDEITYRYIGDSKNCLFCVPDENPLYRYLDRGFFFITANRGGYSTGGKAPVIITNELTLDTYLVLLMVWLNPALSKHLPHECYVNANTAKVLRVRFEKELRGDSQGYERFKPLVIKEYEKSANANLLQKIVDKKLASATYNDIKFTVKSAKYEHVSVTATGLLPILQSHVVFDDRTDIYTLVKGYINYAITKVETDIFKQNKDGTLPDSVEQKFNVNGIDIVVSRTQDNTRRYVNGVPINKAEVEEVCYRASCFTDQDMFTKFLNNVHTMSLKWHDAVNKGVPVKLHPGMLYEDYRNATAPLGSPKLDFKKDGKVFKLVIDDDTAVRVKLPLMLEKIEMINRRTNNGIYRTNTIDPVTHGYYQYRNHEWARQELIKMIKLCCTFTENVRTKAANGEVVVTPRVTCTITDEQANSIGDRAKKLQEAAIEKSKLFLEKAVKATGAVKANFRGEEGFEVQGKLRKYFVNLKTNQVFNVETGRNICIVDAGHNVKIGFDGTAGRLLALKNDHVTMAKIRTLQHG